jgi:hypothetical protein
MAYAWAGLPQDFVLRPKNCQITAKIGMVEIEKKSAPQSFSIYQISKL